MNGEPIQSSLKWKKSTKKVGSTIPIAATIRRAGQDTSAVGATKSVAQKNKKATNVTKAVQTRVDPKKVAVDEKVDPRRSQRLKSLSEHRNQPTATTELVVDSAAQESPEHGQDTELIDTAVVEAKPELTQKKSCGFNTHRDRRMKTMENALGQDKTSELETKDSRCPDIRHQVKEKLLEPVVTTPTAIQEANAMNAMSQCQQFSTVKPAEIIPVRFENKNVSPISNEVRVSSHAGCPNKQFLQEHYNPSALVLIHKVDSSGLFW